MWRVVIEKGCIIGILSLSSPISTDASELGIGGVLLQSRDDKLMPVKYVSRKLLDQERSYSIVEKECLAVVWTVKQLHKYFLQTDHIV